ncbi:hypothetical protein O5537_29035, partial [Escherichia coli]|nr:hypothetical protein [Escherichia coli]
PTTTTPGNSFMVNVPDSLFCGNIATLTQNTSDLFLCKSVTIPHVLFNPAWQHNSRIAELF